MSIVVFSRQMHHKKSEKKHRTITGFLRDLTSSLDFGLKGKAGNPYHVNTNGQIVGYINHGFVISRAKVRNYDRHFAGQTTMYFAGNARSKAHSTLLLIDVDCHHKGTVAGAIKFCEHLRDTLFPGLYFEESGRGAHAYLVVEKQGHHPVFLNSLFKRLEDRLKAVLREGTFDVEDVEVKGTLPVVEWADRARGERPKALSFRAGMLAALPRERDRFRELKATTRIDASFVLKLPVVRPTEPVLPKIRVLPAATGLSGSVSGRVISDDEVQRISGHYLEMAEKLLGADDLRLSGRVKVTAKDVAAFLGLLKFFTNNPNPEGTLPWQRFKALWESLYGSGDIDRQFNPRRFAAVRDLLDSFGLIEWTDRTYRPGGWMGGKYVKGRASKWTASGRLMTMLEEGEEKDILSGSKVEPAGMPAPVEEGEEKDILSGNSTDPLFAARLPEGEEEKDILSSNKVLWPVQKARKDIIRPVPSYVADNYYLLADPGTLVPHYQLAA